MIGQSLSRFRITAKLGEGGMGAVYRAEDSVLGRQVAVKVLPEDFSEDRQRLARFEHEAKVLASLNHPGIVTIYEFGVAVPEPQAEDPSGAGASAARHFLVMELVEGRTLLEEMSQGAMSLERFFDVATPLADALALAHQHGVVHRDLKPGNIMVLPSGALKVLDFGLAKRSASNVELRADAPTETAGLTRDDQIVGTTAYMSPEQIRSGLVDERSDLFSLGVVLYEMLAGQRPFRGESMIDTMSAILREPATDLRALRPELPAPLSDLIAQCLAKDPASRIASASLLRDRLAELRRSCASPSESSSGQTSRPSGFDRASVAVLPFVKLGGAEDAEFLAVGLHADLITELSKMPGINVISRTSVMGYRETEKSMPEIGRELGVGTIIEGTVQSAGARVRLTARLIDSATDAHRWAERYDHELSPETLFSIQSQLTQKIVESLRSKLAADDEIPAGKRQTEDMEAYRLCSLGRMQFDRRTESGFLRAVEYFEQAVEKDPDYVLAWVGLADSLALMEDYGYGDSEILLPRAEAAAARALELDPDSAEAHTSLGLVHVSRKNGPAAMREYGLTVQIQPGYADAHNWMSWMSNLLGRSREALDSALLAVKLSPLSAEAVSNLCLSLLANGKYGKALAEAQRAAELSPGWTSATFYEGLALYHLGRYDEVRSLLPGITVEWAGLGCEATLALAHVALGDLAAAGDALSAIDPGIDGFAVGLVRLALGEVDAAFDAFAAVDRLAAWPTLAVHYLYGGIWDAVRDDSRYPGLVRQAYTSWKAEMPEGGRE